MVTEIPAVFMLATTIASLAILFHPYLRTKNYVLAAADGLCSSWRPGGGLDGPVVAEKAADGGGKGLIKSRPGSAQRFVGLFIGVGLEDEQGSVLSRGRGVGYRVNVDHGVAQEGARPRPRPRSGR